MKKTIIFSYLAIILTLIIFAILGKVSWIVATSPIWVVAAFAYIVLFLGTIAYGIGARLKKKEEAKILPCCANCLHRKTADLLNEMDGTDTNQCIGDKFGENKEKGYCPRYLKA